jgi:hypothetical protein
LFLAVLLVAGFSASTYANDDCATPTVVAAWPFTDTLNTTTATAAVTDPGNSCTPPIDPLVDNYNSVWYSVTPVARGTITVHSAGTTYSHVVAVYTGSCSSLTETACRTSFSVEGVRITLPVEANTTYFLKVVDWYGDGGGGGVLQFGLNYVGDWRFMEAPTGDPRLMKILIDPNDDNLWYVATSGNGLYVTRDGGATWETHLTGYTWGLAIDPTNSNIVYAGSYSAPTDDFNNLYRSEDKGHTWSLVHAFPSEESIYSILVSAVDNSLFVGMHWLGSSNPNGIYKSMDRGESWTLYPFNIPPLPYDQHTRLINWDIAEDAVNGILYAATEPAAKPPCMPSCYNPPTLRSTDGGQTWQNVAGTPGSPGSLYWHATKIEVHPETQHPYFQIEGGWLYTSEDFGDSWQEVEYSWNSAWDLLIDKNHPMRFFSGSIRGYMSVSLTTGIRFIPVGPPGVDSSGLFHVALNSTSTKLYGSYSGTPGGVYVTDLVPPCQTHPATGEILNLVTWYYQSILNRDPEPGGAESWTAEIQRILELGIDVKEGFIALGKLFFNSEEYLAKGKTDETYIVDLYETFLHRTPSGIGEEVGEVDLWESELAGGLTRNLLLNYFIFSEEFGTYMEGIFGICSIRPEYSLVNDLYRGFLSRLPDNDGFNGWLELMQDAQCTGEQAVRDLTNDIGLFFLHSEEYALRDSDNSEYITDLYDAILRRGAELAGYLDWMAELNTGMTREVALQHFVNSNEFQGRVQEVIDAGCSLP